MKTLLPALLLLATPVWSAPLSEACSPVTIHKSGALTQSKADKSTIFVIYNQSQSSVILDRGGPNPGVSAGWATELDANHASALMLDKPEFLLSCRQMKADSSQKVKCADVLTICRYTDFKPKQADGTFWLTENVSPEQIVGKILESGITVNEGKGMHGKDQAQ